MSVRWDGRDGRRYKQYLILVSSKECICLPKDINIFQKLGRQMQGSKKIGNYHEMPRDSCFRGEESTMKEGTKTM